MLEAVAAAHTKLQEVLLLVVEEQAVEILKMVRLVKQTQAEAEAVEEDKILEMVVLVVLVWLLFVIGGKQMGHIQ